LVLKNIYSNSDRYLESLDEAKHINTIRFSPDFIYYLKLLTPSRINLVKKKLVYQNQKLKGPFYTFIPNLVQSTFPPINSLFIMPLNLI
jgi:hypothetical protein